MNAIIYFVISFGAVFTLVLALGQLLLVGKRISNVMLAFFLLSVSIWLGAAGTGRYFYINQFYLLFAGCVIAATVALYCTGPLIFFYFKHILYDDYRLRLGHAFFLVPVIVISALLFLRTQNLGSLKLVTYTRVWDLLVIGAGYTAFFLIMVLFQHFYILFKSRSGLRRLIITSILLCVYYLVSIGVWFGVSWYAGCMMISLSVVIIYLLSVRYPRFLLVLRLEAEKVRYAQSKLMGLDVDALTGMLDHLMQEKKIYTDEAISLSGVAALMGLSAQQLSELVNHYLKKNFNQLVNEYRINSAKKLLLEERSSSILSIGFAVGFNSSSSFYEAFRNTTGMSPSAYRKKSPLKK